MSMRKLFSFVAGLLLVLSPLFFTITTKAYAATSPTLVNSANYSVLSGTTVTNTGATNISGNVGISPSGGGGYAESGTTTYGAGSSLHNADTSAANAQADNLTAFGTLDQGCTTTYAGTQDLVGFNLVPGVYCANAFALSGTLTLSGSGVWIFKSASTLVTSGTANIVGGDPCNVWWRLVSSATIGTNTSLIGNILAATQVTMATGATLNGRAFAYTAAVTLDHNTISGPICSSTTSTSSSSSTSTSTSTTDTPNPPCPTIETGVIAPMIIDSKRVNANSIYISWGPYSGTDKFIVRYGTSKDNLLYNVDVTGFSTTLNALPANQPIWVQVAARNECQVGTFENSILIGGPKLPNTGTGPDNENLLLWGVFAVSSLLTIVYLVRKANQ